MSIQDQILSGDVTWSLGNGWKKQAIRRKSGKTTGTWDMYLFSPEGTKIRSHPDLVKYLERTKAVVDLRVVNMSRVLPASYQKSDCGTEAAKDIHFTTYNTNGQRIRRRIYPTPKKDKYIKEKLQSRNRNVLDKKKKRFLERQQSRIFRPDFDQCLYYAFTLGVDPALVTNWFEDKVKEFEKTERRTPKTFDIEDDQILEFDCRLFGKIDKEMDKVSIVTENINDIS